MTDVMLLYVCKQRILMMATVHMVATTKVNTMMAMVMAAMLAMEHMEA